MVAIQAALAERPIIATDVGGMSEVVISGETGILVNKEDVEALTRSVRVLIRVPSLST